MASNAYFITTTSNFICDATCISNYANGHIMFFWNSDAIFVKGNAIDKWSKDTTSDMAVPFIALLFP